MTESVCLSGLEVAEKDMQKAKGSNLQLTRAALAEKPAGLQNPIANEGGTPIRAHPGIPFCFDCFIEVRSSDERTGTSRLATDEVAQRGFTRRRDKSQDKRNTSDAK